MVNYNLFCNFVFMIKIKKFYSEGVSSSIFSSWSIERREEQELLNRPAEEQCNEFISVTGCNIISISVVSVNNNPIIYLAYE